MPTPKIWISLGTIVSPITGTFFTKITTEYNHKYVLWHNSDYLIKPGEEIRVQKEGILISGELRKIKIIQIDKYSPSVWKVMDRMSSCPGHRKPEGKECNIRAKCIFKTCPYNRKQPIDH